MTALFFYDITCDTHRIAVILSLSQGLLSKIVGLKSIDRASVGSAETCMSLTRYDVMLRNGYNVSTISFERGFFILRDIVNG